MPNARVDDATILAAYEEWDPSVETVDEFAQRIGTSKPTLYTVLKRNSVQPKLRRSARSTNDATIPDGLLSSMGHQAVRVMLDEISTLTRQVVELETEVARLRAQADRAKARSKASNDGASAGL